MFLMDCSSWLKDGFSIWGFGRPNIRLYAEGCATRVELAGAVQRGVVRYARSPLVERCVLVYGMYCSAMSLSFAPEERLNVGRRQRNLVSLSCC